MMKAEATKPVTQKKSHVLFSRGDKDLAAVTRPVTRDEQPLDGAVQARIAARAYALYLERGCREGCDEQDWLDAERDILLRTMPR